MSVLNPDNLEAINDSATQNISMASLLNKNVENIIFIIIL